MAIDNVSTFITHNAIDEKHLKGVVSLRARLILQISGNEDIVGGWSEPIAFTKGENCNE